MNDKPKSITPPPHRDVSTNNQITNVITILHAMYPMLLGRPASFFEPDGVKPPELDGGVKCAAEATFIKACDTLDSILADASRWDQAYQISLENRINEMADVQMRYLRAQTIMTEVLTRLQQQQEASEVPNENEKPKLVRKPTKSPPQTEGGG